MSKPRVPKAAAAPPPPVVPAAARVPVAVRRWYYPGTWLPVLGLAMLLVGAWALLPFGPDPEPRPAINFHLPTVVVDAGHGGQDSGACDNGLREKDLTLDTALRLERHLRQLGFSVILTRRDDRYIDLFQRAHIANQIPRALFVSIHFNDNTTASGDGIETFYAQQKAAFPPAAPAAEWSLQTAFHQTPEPPPADQGAAFAQSIQSRLVARLGVTDRGAKPRQLAVVRLTRCPAVLVEGGFLNNPTEARKLAQPAYREALASAIAEGVAGYQAERMADGREAAVVQR